MLLRVVSRGQRERGAQRRLRGLCLGRSQMGLSSNVTRIGNLRRFTIQDVGRLGLEIYVVLFRFCRGCHQLLERDSSSCVFRLREYRHALRGNLYRDNEGDLRAFSVCLHRRPFTLVAGPSIWFPSIRPSVNGIVISLSLPVGYDGFKVRFLGDFLCFVKE